MPEELGAADAVMKDVLRAMNIPHHECQGWKPTMSSVPWADLLSRTGSVIVTGDRDSLQLIDGNVHVKLVISSRGRPRRRCLTKNSGRNTVSSRKKLIDLKALMGGFLRQYSGRGGVGPKTAEAGEIRQSGQGVRPSGRPLHPPLGKLREKAGSRGKKNAYLSFDLATIRPGSAHRFFCTEGCPLFSPITGWSCISCSRNWNLCG